MGDQRGTLMELAALSLQGLLERPLGRDITGATLAFSHAAPPYREAVEQAFHAQVSSSARQHSLKIPALLARPGALPSLTEIAATEHVSPRTLIRRLKRGNTSYQTILDDIRKTLSRDLLLNSAMTVARISWRLGYRDLANFSRAFRNSYGMSPQQYRMPRVDS